jgi:hypothetical protein
MPGLHGVNLGCRCRTLACIFCETISFSSLRRFAFSATVSARLPALAYPPRQIAYVLVAVVGKPDAA